MTLYTRSGTLTPRAPFKFEHSLRFIANFNALPQSQDVGMVDGRPALSKVFALSGRAVLVQAWAAGTDDAPALDYRLTAAEEIDEALAAAAVDRLSFYLSLDDDLTPF